MIVDGEVVPRHGIECLVKIVIWEFHQGRLRRSPMSERVKYVHVFTCCRCHRVCELSLCSSARLCDYPL
jgi:hypothetical protein